MGVLLYGLNSDISRLAYRPEIDGLRAVAVLSVFVFHLNHQWLPGGFVGVDIFFVISGYLIASILYADCQAGKFSLARFYQRRIARIFPAFFTVALATIAGAGFIYLDRDLASAGANLVAASLSVTNVKYMFQGNYFEISSDAQPFLHYWSLSVEEQFYLVFPLLFFLIFRNGRRHLTLLLALLSFGSLVACVLLTRVNSVWAFYLLPTRVWQLCAGSLLAVIPFTMTDSRAATCARWLPTTGLLLIGCSFVLINEGHGFPGWQAVFPVAGAVAIIFPQKYSIGWIGKWLSSRSMVEIGKMSYSLYLWHWPVFSLIDYKFYLLSDGTRLVLKISLSFMFAFLTFRFIENPLRIFLNQPQSRRVAYAALAAALAFCVLLGAVIRQNHHINATAADVANGGLVFRGKPGARSVVLMGDSNGSMYGKLMKDICADLGWNLTVISSDANDPLPRRNGDSGRQWLDSLDVIRKTKPDYLVLAAHWSQNLQGDLDRLALAIQELTPHIGHLILLNQPPILQKEVNRSSFRAGLRPPFWESKDIQKERQNANDFLLRFQSPKISVIDVSSYFEGKSGEVLAIDEQGRQLYQDPTHLSGYGAEKVRNILKQAISAP